MTQRKRSRNLSILAVFCLFGASGCAATMSALRPEPRNLYVLEPGTPRDVVHGALGAPLVSRARYGEPSDFFEFEQGTSETEKRNRAILHSALFLVTCGYWDLAAVPYEWMDTEILRLEVRYDEAERVVSTVAFSGDVEVPGVTRHEQEDLWFVWDEAERAFAARIEESHASQFVAPLTGVRDNSPSAYPLDSEQARIIDDALSPTQGGEGRPVVPRIPATDNPDQ